MHALPFNFTRHTKTRSQSIHVTATGKECRLSNGGGLRLVQRWIIQLTMWAMLLLGQVKPACTTKPVTLILMRRKSTRAQKQILNDSFDEYTSTTVHQRGTSRHYVHVSPTLPPSPISLSTHLNLHPNFVTYVDMICQSKMPPTFSSFLSPQVIPYCQMSFPF